MGGGALDSTEVYISPSQIAMRRSRDLTESSCKSSVSGRSCVHGTSCLKNQVVRTSPENSKLRCKTRSLGTPPPPFNTSPGKKNCTDFPFQNTLNTKSLYTFQCYKWFWSAYLSEMLHVFIPSRTLRSSSDTRTLKIQHYRRKTHGFRTFSCFGPHIWNSLPQARSYHLLKPN